MNKTLNKLILKANYLLVKLINSDLPNREDPLTKM